MTTTSWISRRRFVQTSAMAALGPQWWAAAGASSLQGRPRLAFVSAMGREQGVHVFAVEDTGWRLLQFVPCAAPVSLALHPSTHTLYVLNAVSEYGGLPLGTVEAYRLNEGSGQLAMLGRQALTLSATMPRHMAVSPDGKMLVVAVHGGGAYNVLPILSDGGLGRVCSVLKETGNGPVAQYQTAAHPQEVVFDTTGTRFLATDLGCDRLSVFSFSATDDGLAAHHRLSMPPGSGPRHLVLHPKGNLLYLDQALDGSASGFHYDVATGLIGDRFAEVRGEFGDALAIHPRGDFLYSAYKAKLSVWHIEPATMTIQPLQTIDLETEAVRAISPLQDGSAIFVLTNRGALGMNVDTLTGRLGHAAWVAEISDSRSIIFQT